MRLGAVLTPGPRAFAGLLALTGLVVLAVAITSQRERPPQPQAGPRVSAPLRVQPRAAEAPRDPSVLARSVPTDLTIPAIGVRSVLQQLGLAADGSLAVPPPGPTYDEAGWYRYSPTPGERGPAVVAGHVDSQRGGPSVFYRLGALRRHDRVLVGRADGSVVTFEVDDVRRYAKAAFPTGLVYGNTAGAALRLITCGGAFDRRTGHYLDNVVVTASLVS
jgi:hypothetical protein